MREYLIVPGVKLGYHAVEEVALKGIPDQRK